MKNFQDNRDDIGAQSKLFLHMTNFVATNHGWKESVALEPSSHLDVEISKDQRSLLNPTARDVQLGSLVDQAFGNRAKKKEAKRRIAVIDGNINSYSRLLNGESQMEMIKDYNCLSASIGQFNAEKDAIALNNANDKRQKELNKEEKRVQKDANEKKNREELMPGM